MPKQNVVKYKLPKTMYEIYDCFLCKDKASYRLGVRSPDGHGYDTEALCEKHYIERCKELGVEYEL